MNSLLQQLMLPQLAIGGIETAFNGLLKRSPHTAPTLRKLAGKVLYIRLNQPDLHFFILFNEQRTDWLNHYEGDIDCHISLDAMALPKLADKRQLSQLINNKTLVLNGDLELLQHFSNLLNELEKNPAELLSPFVGDVVAQVSTDFAQKLFGKAKQQFATNTQDMVENLMTERPVLVHRLEAVNFYDQVEQLAKQAVALEQKFAKLGL